MKIKLNNKSWQHLFHHSIQPKEYGLEYDYGILFYNVIDKPLFFLSVIKHGLEFEESNGHKQKWLSWIDGSPVEFNPIVVCEDILRR